MMPAFQKLYTGYRLKRQRVILTVRGWFRIPQDDVRDQIVDGLRRDLNSLAQALNETVRTLNSANDRLTYYELNVPNIKGAKRLYDKALRKAIREHEKARAKANAALPDPKLGSVGKEIAGTE